MKFLKIAVIVGIGLSLQSCAAGFVWAGVETAKTLAQERPAGERLDDNGIVLLVNDKFIQSDVDDLYSGVGTTISEGRVLLTGMVQQPEHKHQAEEIVWEVAGVKEVMNEIQVVGDKSIQAYGNDVWLANVVSAKLLFTKGIASSNYVVRSVNNTVYLMGIAQDETELRNTIEVARRVDGVERVVNHAILKDDPRRNPWSRIASTYEAEQNSYEPASGNY